MQRLPGARGGVDVQRHQNGGFETLGMSSSRKYDGYWKDDSKNKEENDGE